MTNPTSNYSFQMPTATDLVTDLPADFEVFGQAVDTRLKALQPGTTLGDIAYSSATANTSTRLPIGTSGQVLAVSGGGVPAWTTTADVTPLTTKGDLFTFTTVDARLGVGANGTTLIADSSTATGLKWATPVSGKVLQVVGAFQSTEVASSSTSYADTNLTATITPTSATSKILVLFSQPIGRSDGNSNQAVLLRLFRGATQLGNTFNLLREGNFNFGSCVASSAYLDSPATTSATIYKTTFANSVSAGTDVTVNHLGATSTMTLLEIGA